MDRRPTKINPSDPDLLTALDLFASRVAALVVDRLRAGRDPEWVDQHASALGPRRHCRAARRRIADGSGGAERVGRRWLLTPAAVAEELAAPRRKTKASADDPRVLADELGLRLVPGGSR